jgi:tetratricopeptide (TPR) repeat protein
MRRSLVAIVLALAVLVPAVVAAQDVPEASPQALLHYARGIELYVRGENLAAGDTLMKAYESDSTFFVALLMAGTAYSNGGRIALRDSIYTRLAPYKHRMSLYYQRRLDALIAAAAGNSARAAEIGRTAAQEAPGTKAVYNFALWSLNANRPAEALAALRTLSPDREPMRDWFPYFTEYANATHRVGDFDDELRMAQRRHAAQPDIRSANLVAMALGALGRVAIFDTLWYGVRRMPPVGTLDPGQVMVNAALELMEHGQATFGHVTLQQAIDWYDNEPAPGNQTARARGNRAYTLYLQGRFREALAIYEGLAAEFPATATWQFWIANASALAGEQTRGRAMLRRLEAGDFSLAPANRYLWRGLITASLGDRDAGAALVQQSGFRTRWMRADPNVRRTLHGNAQFVAYLKPEG